MFWGDMIQHKHTEKTSGMGDTCGAISGKCNLPALVALSLWLALVPKAPSLGVPLLRMGHASHVRSSYSRLVLLWATPHAKPHMGLKLWGF